MKRRVSRAFLLCLMAGMIFQGAEGNSAFAAENETVSNLEGETDSEGVTDEELTGFSETEAETESADEMETEEPETEVVEEAETESEEEDSMVGELIFAQCKYYINIRAKASTDGKITAKIYNNGSATVLSVEGEWYEITSGNAHGYVKAEYFATGEEAAAIAEEIAYNVATVQVEYLNIRSGASTDSELVDVAKKNDQLEVVLYGEDWMKVALGNDVYGYIKADYVDYATYYPVAETLEEEKARLIAEGILLAEEAAQTESTDAEETMETQTEAAQTETSAETYVETEAEQTDLPVQTSCTESETSASEYRQPNDTMPAQAPQMETTAQTEAATQTETAAQTEATTVQTETATQTEATVQTETVAQTETDVQTETTAQTEAATQTETEAQTEAWQTETEAQTEAWQTETESVANSGLLGSSSSSSASTGESIANYALQFVGNPYVYGGTSLTDGADCSGFVQSVFANFGIYLSRTAAAQATNGTTVSLSELQAGDLLFYSSTGDGYIDHVAIYIGSGCIVHAANSTRGICTDSAYYTTPVCAVRCY